MRAYLITRQRRNTEQLCFSRYDFTAVTYTIRQELASRFTWSRKARTVLWMCHCHSEAVPRNISLPRKLLCRAEKYGMLILPNSPYARCYYTHHSRSFTKKHWRCCIRAEEKRENRRGLGASISRVSEISLNQDFRVTLQSHFLLRISLVCVYLEKSITRIIIFPLTGGANRPELIYRSIYTPMERAFTISSAAMAT